MQKKIILIGIIIMCYIPARAWDQDEARKLIKYTQKILIKIDNNLAIRQYIPYDIYGDALAELIQARDSYRENNYAKAYYLAAVSSIKLETISLLAEAKKIREKTLILERDFYRKQTFTSDNDMCQFLLNANLQQKGDAYIMIIYDKNLFNSNKKDLSDNSKKKLSKLTEIMNISPSTKITIAGHTSKPDYKDFSKFKAELISKFFQKSGISKERITTYGLGSNEVMDTPWGFKKIDRVELILHDVLQDSKNITSPKKSSSGIGNIKIQ